VTFHPPLDSDGDDIDFSCLSYVPVRTFLILLFSVMVTVGRCRCLISSFYLGGYQPPIFFSAPSLGGPPPFFFFQSFRELISVVIHVRRPTYACIQITCCRCHLVFDLY
jgi:NADH:ubiquinone oxidoreductase subunit H